jgi:hypothetical protein
VEEKRGSRNHAKTKKKFDKANCRENRNDEQIIACMQWKVKASIGKPSFSRGSGLIRNPMAAH